MRIRGARQVVEFNWLKVLAGLAVATMGRTHRAPKALRLASAAAGFWTISSIVVSWWVYDHSELRTWRFALPPEDAAQPRILVVVAGFDEVSPAVRAALPTARVQVVDIANEPEASVRRARRRYPAAAPVVDPIELFPHAAGTASFDTLLFAQSAHEIRDPDRRASMFASAGRFVTTTGAIVVVEHLRDMRNAAAFGPGAWHFQTAAAWRESFATAGMQPLAHRTITPFVHCWTLQPFDADASA